MLECRQYSYANALLWGNFVVHCQEVTKGSCGHRLAHFGLACIELFPVISQIISLFEKIIAQWAIRTFASVRNSQIQTFINRYYNTIWESDLVRKGESPTLYILAEKHDDSNAKKYNALFVNQCASSDGDSHLFIEDRKSGEIGNMQQHNVTQGVTVPVRAFGWDLAYQPLEGQFTPELLALNNKVESVLTQISAEELNRAAVEIQHEQLEAMRGSFKPKAQCPDPMECLSKMGDCLPTTCESKFHCIARIMENPQLQQLSQQILQWKISKQGVYDRNCSLLNTLEGANIDLTQNGPAHFLIAGSAHVTHLDSQYQEAVDLVHNSLKNKKVVILEPKSSFLGTPFRNATRALNCIRPRLIKEFSIFLHEKLSHDMDQNFPVANPRISDFYRTIAEYSSATDEYSKAGGDGKRELTTRLQVLTQQQFHEEDRARDSIGINPAPISPAFLRHCFHLLRLPEEAEAVCLAAAKPVCADLLNQFVTDVVEQEKHQQLRFQYNYNADGYYESGQYYKRKNALYFSELRPKIQNAMLLAVGRQPIEGPGCECQ